MRFRTFAERARKIEETDADLEIVGLVADLLRAADRDFPILARFVQGRVFPAHASRTLDVGPSGCYAVLARAAGPNISAEDVEDRLAETGDVGEVAADLDLGGQAGLGAFASAGENSEIPGADGGGGGRSVSEVFADLEAIADAAGSGSEGAKEDRLYALFVDCEPVEARYLSRLVLEELRIGVAGGTVRDAIAEAFDVPAGEVERALQVTNDYGLVAERARDEGSAGLSAMGLEVGRPIQAMLAQTGTVSGALEDWEAAIVETKLDGARVQVHVESEAAADGEESAGASSDAPGDLDSVGAVHLFSRNMEDVTDALPEIVAFVREHCEAPAILDGEVVAVDDDGDPLPFQEVLRRFRRKHDVAAAREDIETELRVFDCLHAPASVHASVEYDEVPRSGAKSDGATADSGGLDEEDGQAGLDQWGAESADPEAAEMNDTQATARGVTAPKIGDLDGPGVDLLDAPLSARREYLETVIDDGVVAATTTDDPDEIEAIEAEALAAGHEGIMLKNPDAAYTPGRRGKDWRKRKPDVETLDLVVTGAEWGEGRRAELLGTFEVAARNEDGFVPLGKVATGLTDEELAALHDRVEPHVRGETGQDVDVEPAVVLEVGYEEIQRSPTYEGGYALRFPRFVAVREDLAPDEADALERVERLADEQ